MSVYLHIDRLLVEGTGLTPRDATRLKAALGAELAELLRDRPLQAEIAQGTAVPQLPAPPFPLPAKAEPNHVGRGIARSLADALAPPARPAPIGPKP